jgi:uncharacterized protein YcbK (DUF882 family)
VFWQESSSKALPCKVIDSGQCTSDNKLENSKTFSRPRQKKSEDKPWFYVECKLARQNYRKLRTKYKKNQTEKNKEELNNSEKYYKRTLDKNQKLYRNKITKQLRNLHTNNPKEYWKILNSGRHKKQPNISIENLLQFFKN